jgi:hypothetical protein
MRCQIFGLTLALAAGAAFAQPINENRPGRTIQCIDVGGHLLPAVCQAPGSRLDRREFICTCPSGGERVEVAVCARGQREPPEGRALFKARSQAMRDGSLIGDKVGDRPICVAPRGRP